MTMTGAAPVPSGTDPPAAAAVVVVVLALTLGGLATTLGALDGAGALEATVAAGVAPAEPSGPLGATPALVEPAAGAGALPVPPLGPPSAPTAAPTALFSALPNCAIEPVRVPLEPIDPLDCGAGAAAAGTTALTAAGATAAGTTAAGALALATAGTDAGSAAAEANAAAAEAPALETTLGIPCAFMTCTS